MKAVALRQIWTKSPNKGSFSGATKFLEFRILLYFDVELAESDTCSEPEDRLLLPLFPLAFVLEDCEVRGE
ncbi:MAG: hypothetical protein MN733_21380 [Nitrososphaera sp.]|nr:hypothetical protein [Nitrososphaera sp.]